MVLFCAVVETGDKAPLSLCVIARQQKRKLIKTIHFLSKDAMKLLSCCVLIRCEFARFNSVEELHRAFFRMPLDPPFSCTGSMQSWPEP